MTTHKKMSAGGALAVLALVFATVGAYLTHIWWMIHSLMISADPITLKQGILAVLGTFVPPVGVVHGLIIWFT